MPSKAAEKRTARPWKIALLEILSGSGVACWCVDGLVKDPSSLGAVYYFWGFLACAALIVIPGVLLLVPWRLPQLATLLFLPILGFYYLPGIAYTLWASLAQP